jgi:hypothetical protein
MKNLLTQINESATIKPYIKHIIGLILFLLIPNLVTTPLRIFVEAVIYNKKEAPAFISAGFIIYSFIVEIVFYIGYFVLGRKLPIKNTVLRGFAYIMLILFSSYLPNILAMTGGDGQIISDSLSIGIIVVDIISYTIKGLVLGLVNNNDYIDKPEDISPITGFRFTTACLVNGVLFAALNYLFDMGIGAIDRSWKLSSLLGVSSQRETAFYIIFILFMFVAGFIITLWYRYNLPAGTLISGTVLFGLKLSVITWLPNVLIMAFFGTPFVKTFTYGVVYIIMFVICVLIYRKIFLTEDVLCNNMTQMNSLH